MMPPTPRTTPLRILVAEDDADTSTALCLRLEAAGYEVERVLDGESVLPHAKRFAPDLILLDLGLPGCDGFEVLARLASDGVTVQIPVVVLSARDATMHEPSALAAGAKAYIEKPSKGTELLEIVASVLRASASPHGSTNGATQHHDEKPDPALAPGRA